MNGCANNAKYTTVKTPLKPPTPPPKPELKRSVDELVTNKEESPPPIYKRPSLERRESSLRSYHQVVFPTICEGIVQTLSTLNLTQ